MSCQTPTNCQFWDSRHSASPMNCGGVLDSEATVCSRWQSTEPVIVSSLKKHGPGTLNIVPSVNSGWEPIDWAMRACGSLPWVTFIVI